MQVFEHRFKGGQVEAAGAIFRDAEVATRHLAAKGGALKVQEAGGTFEIGQGFYRNSAIATGSPIASSLYWSVLHFAHSSDGTSSQFAMRSAGVSANQMYFRRKAGGVWSAWDKVFHSGNLLGTVSQTGGLPTGAVIERGENANGTYTKYADGTMECLLTPATFVYSTADLILFTATFPAPFLTGSLPVVTSTLSSVAGDYTGLSRRDLSGFAQGAGTAGAVLSFTRPSGASRSFTTGDQVANVRLKAKGRWF